MAIQMSPLRLKFPSLRTTTGMTIVSSAPGNASITGQRTTYILFRQWLKWEHLVRQIAQLKVELSVRRSGNVDIVVQLREEVLLHLIDHKEIDLLVWKHVLPHGREVDVGKRGVVPNLFTAIQANASVRIYIACAALRTFCANISAQSKILSQLLQFKVI